MLTPVDAVPQLPELLEDVAEPILVVHGAGVEGAGGGELAVVHLAGAGAVARATGLDGVEQALEEDRRGVVGVAGALFGGGFLEVVLGGGFLEAVVAVVVSAVVVAVVIGRVEISPGGECGEGSTTRR